MSVFRLTMLPANEGDSLILSFGKSEDKLQHVVIDGGRKAAWPHLKKALGSIAARGEGIELLVLSHIDADHIDGLVEFVKDPDTVLEPKEVWYNGYDQLKGLNATNDLDAFGFPAADDYTKALAKKRWATNDRFGGKAILVDNEPSKFEIGELKLWLVSPNKAKLDRLIAEWDKWRKPKATVNEDAETGPDLVAFGKRPMPDVLDIEVLSAASKVDTTAPNGSSIAFVAEYDGRSVLLAADAHPDVLLQTLTALSQLRGTSVINLVKLPHHASRANVTKDLIETMDCSRFAVSTSGAQFGHPDPEAISRILKFGRTGSKTFYFNYASDRTLPWSNAVLQDMHNYECIYPDSPNIPVVIDI